LIGIDQALGFTHQCSTLAHNPPQLALTIRQLRTIAVLLLLKVGQEYVRLLQELADMVPDHRLNVPLADTPQLAAPLSRLKLRWRVHS
jgi:hypothetical protein